ncbi:cryptochrome/photolyase family protein [uncultured Enterovirga sp.]|uniref:cryptochrome/photolyase family protein n=1 Tax=uncultured Enterovirga sp. TaxID=2026352 RepID=UPI0035CB485B
MTTLRLILGDQLHRRIASLGDIDPERDTVLIAEVMGEATYVRHHQQKIAFLFSAMRHFAEELRGEGIRVGYMRLEDEGNTGTLGGEVARAAERLRPDRIVVTEPGEWRVLEMMRGWSSELGIPVEIRDDNRFLCSRAEFARWGEGRASYRMETFYREMRRKTGLLMDGDAPEGGRWNFDRENRKPLPAQVEPPEPPRFEPDAITRDVLDLVRRRFGAHFGRLEPFRWAVTRADALRALRHFVEYRLALYGDYQDAMRQGADFLFHSVLSPYLNAGLLTAEEVAREAERAYREGLAPLNAVEGFIRQIIGWREYVRGVYWLRMPDYAASNALGADRPLPWFYWSGETRMNCLSEAIRNTAEHAWAHHIQRLMVTGNFALIAGLRPSEVEDWYLVVYADAYEWVELPNVHGMILFADGGVLGSKPYASSGAYIDRMSDYCGSCRYDVRKKAGPDACPFNYLYWDFMARNEATLRGNHRLDMPYRTLDRMKPARRTEIAEDSARFLASAEMSPEPGVAADRPAGQAELF